jgi:uroporphyrinogen decarboxylase
MPKVAYWAPEDELTSMERVAGHALEHKEGDRNPVAPVMANACCRMTGLSNPEFSRDAYLAFQAFVATSEVVGHDVIVPLIDLSIDGEGFHIGERRQPIKYPEHDAARVDYDNPLITSPDDYTRLESFDVREEGRRTKYIQDLSHYLSFYFQEQGTRLGNKNPQTPVIYGPLGVLGTLRGVERLFVDVRKTPEKTKAALDLVTDELCEQCKAICDSGPAVLYMITLFSGNVIMSKKAWNEAEAPWLARMAETIRNHPSITRVGIHNCGNGPYFEEIINCVKHEPRNPFSFAYVPDDCEDADDPDAAVKEKWGQKITLFGYVVPATFAYLGTPMEMYNESCRLLDKCMKGGGFVLSCGCEFPPNGPFINAISQCVSAHECGRYDGKTVKLPFEFKDWVLPERRGPAPPPAGWEPEKRFK